MDDKLLKILLVEDSEADGYYLKQLVHTQFEVVWFRSCSTALDYCLKNDTSDVYAFLIDIKLPDPKFPQLEGTSLATWLSDQMQSGDRPARPIIAYTAALSNDIALDAIAAGCAASWEKPVNQTHIRALLTLPDSNLSMDFNRWQHLIRKHHLAIINDIILNPIHNSIVLSANDISLLLSLLYSVNCPKEQVEYRDSLCADLGGIRMVRQIVETAMIDLNPELLKTANLLTKRYQQLRIMTTLGISRRKMDSHLEAICEHISERVRRG